ncbi:hypothetical protein GG804_22135 [Sphingomonas histidinilytica]|uniref:hypothetical protein n=1 Tax=Sphingomonadales TaxID=204457 RepID=UPI0007705AAB|nr:MULTISPECIES: hypothetical protein [Sphingomonadaceae]AMK23123.1 hypothetical protein K426_10905 [Sphingobium sp. TKS]MBO9379475.1 hypothetical protein [Rhizorhabdus histidinilytica]MCF8707638.1 hypothetical protein [Rhizorhapis sp. SPR117]
MNEASQEPRRVSEIAILPSRQKAEAAIAALAAAGFSASDISLFIQSPTDQDVNKPRDDNVDEAIEAGGERGAGIGATAGGLGGLLAEIGVLAVPGIGPMIAAGPLAATLTGVIAGSALGGVAGSLIGFGISEAQAKAAENHLKAGRAVLVIQCGGRVEEALAILRAHGAFRGEPH